MNPRGAPATDILLKNVRMPDLLRSGDEGGVVRVALGIELEAVVAEVGCCKSVSLRVGRVAGSMTSK